MTEYKDVNGNPVGGSGQTIIIDNSVQEFTIKLRSLGGIHPDAIKRKLQEKWEVLMVELKNETNYVHTVKDEWN